MSEWISVDERLPEVQTPVLGFVKGCGIDIVSRSGNTGEFNHGYRIIPKPPVTHWMPLPPNPEVAGQARCDECHGTGAKTFATEDSITNPVTGREVAVRELRDCEKCRGTGWVKYVNLRGKPAKASIHCELCGGTGKTPLPPPPATPTLNQCDGCRRGSPIVNGLHVDMNGHSYMACCKDKYEPPATPGEVG